MSLDQQLQHSNWTMASGTSGTSVADIAISSNGATLAAIVDLEVSGAPQRSVYISSNFSGKFRYKFTNNSTTPAAVSDATGIVSNATQQQQQQQLGWLKRIKMSSAGDRMAAITVGTRVVARRLGG